MSYPLAPATPVRGNVQYFYRSGDWTKPVGVQHIYMLLIGGGGNNATATGGGSGAVTVWFGAAANVPNNLVLTVSTGNNVATTVSYRGTNGLNTLLTANAANTNTAGAATTTPIFAVAGIYQSIAGQAGAAGAQSASTTTFLSGGAASTNTVTANYGYSATSSFGHFTTSPIIVGLGNSSGAQRAAIGCGGTGTSGTGGPGLIIIASW